ncbi:hypothetical protein K438DRAFT_1854881, partial [Mycena galopus ATCC 62051]
TYRQPTNDQGLIFYASTSLTTFHFLSHFSPVLPLLILLRNSHLFTSLHISRTFENLPNKATSGAPRV